VTVLLRNLDGETPSVACGEVSTAGHRFRVDRVPTVDSTPRYGDFVIAKPNREGVLVFLRKVADGDFTTDALVYSAMSSRGELLQWLGRRYGAVCEVISAPEPGVGGHVVTGLIVVAVPTRVSFAKMAAATGRCFPGVFTVAEDLRRVSAPLSRSLRCRSISSIPHPVGSILSPAE
jgi:hypothetical protein